MPTTGADATRYIAHWTQETVYPFRGLTYVALGLSRDQRWFAVATAFVTPKPVPGEPPERSGQSDAYEAALTQQILTDPAVVSPSIGILDAVTTGLVVPCDPP